MTAYGAPCPLAFQLRGNAHRSFRPSGLRIETLAGHADRRSSDRHRGRPNLIADEAISFHPALPAKVDAAPRPAARALPTRLMLAAGTSPEGAAEGRANLRGATIALPRWASYHLRPFGQACHRGLFSAAGFAQQLEDAGDGRAWRPKSIDEITALLGNDFPRQIKAACGNRRWAHDPFGARLLFATRCLATPGSVRCSPHPSITGCFFAGEAERRRTFFLHPRNGGAGFGGRGRAGEVVASKHEP